MKCRKVIANVWEDMSLRYRQSSRVSLLLSLLFFILRTFTVEECKVFATPMTLRLNDSFIADARDDNKNGALNDDNYQLVVNRLSMGGQYQGYMFDCRLDTMYFHDEPTTDFKTILVRPERASISKRFRLSKGYRLFMQAGDFYQQLGKGQLLALRKVDELGVDISLRGGKIAMRGKDFNLQMFGGVSNVVNVDMVSMHYVADQNDVIMGGQTGYRLPIGGEAGIMYVFLGPDEQTVDQVALKDATSSTVRTLKKC